MTTIKFDLDTVPADDRQRVEASIPDPRLAAAYIHRGVKGVDEFDLLDVAIEERENVILRGPTGSAKTTLFRAYAADRRLPCCIIDSAASMDPGLIVGRTTIDSDGAARYVDGDLTLVVRYGGVALIDEINMAHPRITAAWHQLFAVTRRMSIPEAGETVIAGRGGLGCGYEESTDEDGKKILVPYGETQPVLFGSAYNHGYQGVVRLNEALGNRFAMPLDWGYDESVERQLVTSSTLLEQCMNIRSLQEIRTPVSTNMMMEFERHAERLGVELAIHLFMGHFADEERGGVARALEGNSARIAAELSAE